MFIGREKELKNLNNLYDTAAIYGMVGGTPQYLLQMDDNISLEQNIKDKLLNSISYLFEEPPCKEIKALNLLQIVGLKHSFCVGF